MLNEVENAGRVREAENQLLERRRMLERQNLAERREVARMLDMLQDERGKDRQLLDDLRRSETELEASTSASLGWSGAGVLFISCCRGAALISEFIGAGGGAPKPARADPLLLAGGAATVLVVVRAPRAPMRFHIHFQQRIICVRCYESLLFLSDGHLSPCVLYPQSRLLYARRVATEQHQAEEEERSQFDALRGALAMRKAEAEAEQAARHQRLMAQLTVERERALLELDGTWRKAVARGEMARLQEESATFALERTHLEAAAVAEEKQTAREVARLRRRAVAAKVASDPLGAAAAAAAGAGLVDSTSQSTVTSPTNSSVSSEACDDDQAGAGAPPPAPETYSAADDFASAQRGSDTPGLAAEDSSTTAAAETTTTEEPLANDDGSDGSSSEALLSHRLTGMGHLIS